MTQIQLLSVDMFQTLVDVNSRIPSIWRRILQDRYEEQKAYQYAGSLISNFMVYYNQYIGGDKEFVKIRKLYEDSFAKLFSVEGLNFEADKAAEIIIDEHGCAETYPDTEQFLKNVKQEIPVCLVSDADLDMIAPLLNRFKFEQAFISEKLGIYKSQTENILFRSVINHFGIEPEHILHIGDSYADILGANLAGMKTCWLNREDKDWTYDLKPDYIVNSLVDVCNILKIDC